MTYSQLKSELERMIVEMESTKNETEKMLKAWDGVERRSVERMSNEDFIKALK